MDQVAGYESAGFQAGWLLFVVVVVVVVVVTDHLSVKLPILQCLFLVEGVWLTQGHAYIHLRNANIHHA